MQKKKSNLFQPLVIFFRLFSFIMDSLIPRGFKRVVTTSQSMRQASTVVPMVSSKPNVKRVELQPQAHCIKHSDELGSWADVTRPKIQKSAQIHELCKEKEEDERNSKMFVESSNINFVEEERKRLMKGKSVTIEFEPEEVKLSNRPSRQRQRQVRPLFDVAVNINEKSDAFIRSRKEAMRRNFT